LVTRLKVAPILPKVHVHTSVTGTGRARTLHWTASNLDGQRLTFLERSKSVTHTIGSTTKRSGHMALFAANGPAGRRNIEADFTDRGAPVSHSVVGHYNAPGFIKPGRVKHLRIRRHGKSATVRWHKAARAQGYVATIKGTDGRKELRFTAASVRHFTVKDLEPYAGFKVTVRAYYGSTHETGRAAHATLAHHRLPTAVKRHHHHRH
jgi:hypothetical protein